MVHSQDLVQICPAMDIEWLKPSTSLLYLYLYLPIYAFDFLRYLLWPADLRLPPYILRSFLPSFASGRMLESESILVRDCFSRHRWALCSTLHSCPSIHQPSLSFITCKRLFSEKQTTKYSKWRCVPSSSPFNREISSSLVSHSATYY